MEKPKVGTDLGGVQTGTGALGYKRDYLLSIDPISYYYNKFKDTGNTDLDDAMWEEAARQGRSEELLDILLQREKLEPEQRGVDYVESGRQASAESTGNNTAQKLYDEGVDIVSRYKSYGLENLDAYITALSVPLYDDTTPIKDLPEGTYSDEAIEYYGDLTERQFALATLNQYFVDFDNQRVEEWKSQHEFWSFVGDGLVSTLGHLTHGLTETVGFTFDLAEGLFTGISTGINHMFGGTDDPNAAFLSCFQNDDPFAEVNQEFERDLKEFDRKYCTYYDAKKGEYDWYGNIITGVNESIGFMLPSIALAIPTGGASLIIGGTKLATKTALKTAIKAATKGISKSAGKDLGRKIGPSVFYTQLFSSNISDTVKLAADKNISYKDLNAGEVILNAGLKALAEFGIEYGLGKLLGFFSVGDKLIGLGRAATRATVKVAETEVKAFGAKMATVGKEALKEGTEEVLQNLSSGIIDYAFSALGTNLSKVYEGRASDNINIQNLIDAFVAGAVANMVLGTVADLKYIPRSNREVGDNEKGEPVKLGMFRTMQLREAMATLSQWNRTLQDPTVADDIKRDTAFKMSAALSTLGSVYKSMGEERAFAANNILYGYVKNEQDKEAIEKLSQAGYATSLFNDFAEYRKDYIKKYIDKVAQDKIKKATKNNEEDLKKSGVTKFLGMFNNKVKEDDPDTEVSEETVRRSKKMLDKLKVKNIVLTDGDAAIKDKENETLFVSERFIMTDDVKALVSTLAFKIFSDEVLHYIQRTETQLKMAGVFTDMAPNSTAEITNETLIAALAFDSEFYVNLLLACENNEESRKIFEILDEILKYAVNKARASNVSLEEAAAAKLAEKCRNTMRVGLIKYFTCFGNISTLKIPDSIRELVIEDIKHNKTVIYNDMLRNGMLTKSDDIIQTSADAAEKLIDKARTVDDAITSKLDSIIPGGLNTIKQHLRSSNINERVEAYAIVDIMMQNMPADFSKKYIELPYNANQNTDAFVEMRLELLYQYLGNTIPDILSGNYDANALSIEAKSLILSDTERYDMTTREGRYFFVSDAIRFITNNRLSIDTLGNILLLERAENVFKDEYIKDPHQLITDIFVGKVNKLSDICKNKIAIDVDIICDKNGQLHSGTTAAYNFTRNMISVPAPNAIRNINTLLSDIMHEATHAIQTHFGRIKYGPTGTSQLTDKDIGLSLGGNDVRMFLSEDYDKLQEYILETFPNLCRVVQQMAGKPLSVAAYVIIDGEFRARFHVGSILTDLGFTYDNTDTRLISPDGTHRFDIMANGGKGVKQITSLPYYDYMYSNDPRRLDEIIMDRYGYTITSLKELAEEVTGLDNTAYSPEIFERLMREYDILERKSKDIFSASSEYSEEKTDKITQLSKRKNKLKAAIDYYRYISNTMMKVYTKLNDKIEYSSSTVKTFLEKIGEGNVNLADRVALVDLLLRLRKLKHDDMSDTDKKAYDMTLKYVEYLTYDYIADILNAYARAVDMFENVIMGTPDKMYVDISGVNIFDTDVNDYPTLPYEIKRVYINGEPQSNTVTINNAEADKSNLKYFERKGRQIRMHQGIRDFIVATTANFGEIRESYIRDRIVGSKQNPELRGTLNMKDISDFIDSASNISDYTFQMIAKYIYGNKALARMKFRGFVHLKENLVEKYGPLAYFYRGDKIEDMTFKIKGLSELYDKMNAKAEELDKTPTRQLKPEERGFVEKWSKAVNNSGNYYVDRDVNGRNRRVPQHIEIDPKKLNKLFFNHYDGTLRGLREIMNKAKNEAWERRNVKLDETSKNVKKNTNYVFREPEGDTNHVDLGKKLSRAEMLNEIEQSYTDKAEERIRKLDNEADKRQAIIEYDKHIREKMAEHDTLTDEELRKLYEKRTGKKAVTMADELPPPPDISKEPASKKTYKDEIDAVVIKIKREIGGSKVKYNWLSDDAKKYLDFDKRKGLVFKTYTDERLGKTYRIHRKYDEAQLQEMLNTLRKAYKDLVQKVHDDEVAKIAKEEGKRALGNTSKQVNETIERQKEQIREQAKRIKELEKENTKLSKEKQDIEEEFKRVTVRGIKDKFFNKANKSIPPLVKNLLKSPWTKTRMNSSQFLENEEAFVANGQTFYEENADAFANATAADLEEACDWFMQSGIESNPGTPAFKNYLAIQAYFFAYVLEMDNKKIKVIDKNKRKEYELYMSNLFGTGAALLAIKSHITEKLDPFAAHVAANMVLDGVTLPKELKQGLFDSIQQDDMNLIKNAMRNIINYVDKNQTAKKSIYRRITSYRAMAMLSSPLTWLRNKVSNMAVKRINKWAEKIGRKLFKTDKEGQITLADKASDEAIAYVKEHFIDSGLLDTLVHNVSKYNPSDIRDKNRRNVAGKATKESILSQLIVDALYGQYYNESTFKSSAMTKIHDFLMRMLSDEKYIRNAAIDYMSRIVTEKMKNNEFYAQGIRDGEVSDAVMNDFAATFGLALSDYMHQDNFFNRAERAIAERNDLAWFGYKLLLPFAATSWNWFKGAIRMSPLGLIWAIKNSIKLENRVKKIQAQWEKGDSQISGELAQYITRRELGQGVIGTILWGVGILLAVFGAVRLEDEDYGTPKLTFFGGRLKVDVSSIFGTSSLLAGAALVTGMEEKGITWEGFMEGMNRATEVTLDGFPLMSILEMDMYSEGAWNIGVEYLESTAISFIPNFVAYVASGSYAFEVDKSNYLYRVAAKIPGLAYALPKKANPYTGQKGSLWDIFNRVVPYFSWDYASQVEVNSRGLGLNKKQLRGSYDINGAPFKVTGKDLEKVNTLYGQLNAQDLEKFYFNRLSVLVKVGNVYKKLRYNQMTDDQRKHAVQSIMTTNAEAAKVYAWTMKGNKYYATEAEYSRLRNKGIKSNVYKGTKGFVEK